MSLNLPLRLFGAIDGNTTSPAARTGTLEARKTVAKATAKAMPPRLEHDNHVVLIHIRQVGSLPLANAIAPKRAAPR